MLEPEYWGDPAGNIHRMSGDQEIIATATPAANPEEWNALCSIGTAGHPAKCDKAPDAMKTISLIKVDLLNALRQAGDSQGIYVEDPSPQGKSLTIIDGEVDLDDVATILNKTLSNR
jgi:hypothetical protein